MIRLQGSQSLMTRDLKVLEELNHSDTAKAFKHKDVTAEAELPESPIPILNIRVIKTQNAVRLRQGYAGR